MIVYFILKTERILMIYLLTSIFWHNCGIEFFFCTLKMHHPCSYEPSSQIKQPIWQLTYMYNRSNGVTLWSTNFVPPIFIGSFGLTHTINYFVSLLNPPYTSCKSSFNLCTESLHRPLYRLRCSPTPLVIKTSLIPHLIPNNVAQ